MPEDFDPYHKWLGIPATERPANHYRLLGIPKFEENPDVISNAADARMAFIRTFQGGPRGPYSQQILNELGIARTTLLNAPRKANYDAELRAGEAAKSQGMAVVPVAAEAPNPQQQQAALELQRQLEAVRAREAQLAQQQAQYAAALAQAESLKQAQAQREAFVRQREAQLAAAMVLPQTAQPDPFASLATAPAITVGRPQKKKSPWDSVPLPVLIGAVAIPALLLLLLAGYLLSRGSTTTPVTESPEQPIVTPMPPVVKPPSPIITPTTPVVSPTQPVLKPATPDEGQNRNTTPITTPSVTPAGNAAMKSVDLLGLIETPRDVPQGEASRNKDHVVIRNPGSFGGMVVPHALPKNYQIDLKVTQRSGTGISLGFPVNGRPCTISIDGFFNVGQMRTALECIDGIRAYEPGYSGKPWFGQLLKKDVESQLSLRVVENTIKFSCDGKPVIDWTGDPASLSLHSTMDLRQGTKLMIATWMAQYEVSGITLQPMEETLASSPVASGGETRPWRWARHPGDCKGFTLTPDRKRAVHYHVARAPWSIHGLDVSNGDYDQRIDGQGTVEGQYTFAASVGAKIVAFSLSDGGNTAMLVKSMPSGSAPDRVYGKKPNDARYQFSADGKFLASSGGRDNALIQLHNVETGNPTGRISPPGELTNLFVERMFEANGQLLALYSGQQGGQLAHLVVAFDWQTLQPKRRWQITPGLDIRGMTFENDLLWVWGAEGSSGPVVMTFRAGAGVDAKPDYPLRGARAQGTSVSDIHIPSRTAAIIDANGARLSVRNWGNNWKLGVVQYRVPVRDARFVEDGKALLVQPTVEQDPTLLWETEPLLDAQRVTAPTLQELGLANNPQLAGGVKAIQSKDLPSAAWSQP